MDLLCSEIKHRWGESVDSGHIEIFYSTLPNGETVIHKKQPIPPNKPSITPPDRVGLDNGWCTAAPIKTNKANPQASEVVEPVQTTSEAGMGTFFLLVLVITGGIAAFQHYRKKLEKQFSEPKYLPNPWAQDLPSNRRVVPREYGDFIEEEYPPSPEERLDSVTLDQSPREYLRSAELTHLDSAPLPSESIGTPKNSDENSGTSSGLNSRLDQLEFTLNSLLDKMSSGLNSGIVTPELAEPEPPFKVEDGMTEYVVRWFNFLVTEEGVSPISNEIITKMWGVKSGGSKAFSEARKMRDQLANRLEEFNQNEPE